MRTVLQLLLRGLAWALGGLVAVAVLAPLLYAALAETPRPVPDAVSTPPAGTYRVAVVDWGYHTAIVIEQPPGAALGPPGEARAPHVEFAWGDRAFYYAADYRPWVLFASAALPTASATFVDGVRLERLEQARAVYTREVDAETLGRLLASLEASITRAPSGARAEPYPNDERTRGRFYPSPDRYLWTRSCNWWTVQRLHDAGLAQSPRGVVFSGQVGGRLVGFEEVGAGAP